MTSIARARALSDYDAQTDGEVSFTKGEVVTVDLQAEAPDGYLQVTVASTGASGMAPMMGMLAIEGNEAQVCKPPCSPPPTPTHARTSPEARTRPPLTPLCPCCGRCAHADCLSRRRAAVAADAGHL